MSPLAILRGQAEALLLLTGGVLICPKSGAGPKINRGCSITDCSRQWSVGCRSAGSV